MNPASQLENIKKQALSIQGKLNTMQEAEKTGASVNSVQEAEKMLERPPVTPVSAPDGTVAAETLTSGGTPDLPEPTADTTQETYQNGLTEQAKLARTELENTLKTERDAALKRQEDLNKKLEKLMQDQDPTKRDTFAQEERIVQNQLDAAETASASLEEDFAKRRKTVNELDTLLTQGNQLIEQARNAPITKYRSRNVTREMQNVQARAGVLQAVISGLDGNINFAHSIINNASSAVASVWQDQLAYNQAYMSLVESGELAKNKIQDDYANSQIVLAEQKLNQLEETKSYIQGLMIDPASAQFIADAGITLNDSVEEINTKMQEQTSKQEREDTINELTMDGYEYVPFAEGRDDVVTLEVGGKTLSFVPPVDEMKELDLKKKRAEIRATNALAAQRLGGGQVATTPSGAMVQAPTFEEWAAENGGRVWHVGGSEQQMQELRREYEEDIELMTRANALSTVSPRAADALKNPMGFFNRTNTEKGEILDELANAGIDTTEITQGKKRPMTATQADDLVQAQIAYQGVQNLKTMLDGLDSTGPVIGALREANPYDPEVVAIVAEINRIVPGLARGVFKEVGVLTDTDIDRYTRTLANPRATKEQINALHEDTMNKIEQSLEIIQSTYSDLGYDLGKFEFKTVGSEKTDEDPLGLNI